MTNIYLIRHTQAEGNLYRIMQGHWDGDVTEDGLKQIAALAERFRDVKIDALYSSDLYRTRRTAGAITRYHELTMQLDPSLREINMGDWEARFFGDLIAEDSAEIRAFLTNPDGLRIPGGESCAEVGARMVSTLKRIAAENDGRTVAVVSHGMAIRCALAAINGCSLSEQPIVRNTSVSALCVENGNIEVEYIDDVSHLSELPAHSWSNVPALHARCYTPGADDGNYISCYADCWQAAHGSLAGFSKSLYLEAAARHSMADNRSVIFLYDGDILAGLVDLDIGRGASEGYGWISLLYLREEYRNRGIGIQLLGRAIVLYRALGRSSLRFTVAGENTSALAFYRKYGFSVIGEDRGACGKLFVMEAPIESRR